MQCSQCSFENPLGMAFCGKCGAKLALPCASCSYINPAEFAFCGKCGSPLNVETAASAFQPAPKFASPQAYTPKHLAEKILTSKSALEGERKQVTVLFADMKGSMELLADRDPEEARKLLDPVIEHMMEAVHRYEGTVSNLMGDGIMALFGAPLAHEDHAVRACYAALRMQESVNRYADGVRRTEGVPIQIRVGLNSGEVVVGAIGNDLKMDYTAIGQTVHLASRMEQMATPGSIMMTADALRLAEGYVQVKSLGPVNVKGMSEPVEAYEVTGAGTARTRLQAAASRGLSRFVGRDAETEQLRKALEQARAGQGQVVAVVGEPGVGKSRLFYEFTHSHRTEGCLIVDSGSVSYGKATPYLPVIDLLKAYFKIQDRDNQRDIREKVTGKLLTLDKTLEPALPAFLSLLDVATEDEQWQNFDPPQRRQRTLDAVKRLLLRESQVQPLLVVIEDLHWIDSETQAFLDNLVDSLPTARLLLLVNYRPEYQHGWGSKTYYRQLRIDPLPPESAEELLHALLGNDPTLKPLRQLLIERTEGNPFFLEESVRTLVETNALEGEWGRYHVAKTIESTQMPATVQVVLAARIDRLSPEDKRLLQSAAVIGEGFPFVILQAIVEFSEEELRRGLAHLQAAEFLYETSLFPDLEYTFKHGLTYQVAYNSLLAERRRALHAQILAAIEQLYPDRLAEQVELLAHHALRGEFWEKAVAYLRQAGIKAATRSANREAVAYFEQALVALQHIPESHDTLTQAVDLRIDLRQSLYPLGEIERILDNLREAETLAKALGDQHRLGWIAAYILNCFWSTGNKDRAIEFGQRALTIAEAVADITLQVEGNYRLGQVYWSLGDYRQAIACFERNVVCLKGDLIRERFGMPGLPSVNSRAWMVWCLAEQGAFAEAMEGGEDVVHLAEALAEAMDHPFSLSTAYWGVGHLYLRHGDLDKAIPAFERALEVSQVGHIRLFFPWYASQVGYTYALAGRVAEALPLLEQAVQQAASMKLTASQSLWIAYLSEAYLLAGRMDDAITQALRALDLSRDHKERGHQAWVCRLLGEIAAREDPLDIAKAENHYRQALALAEELGMRPLIAHCHVGLGKLYRRIGNLQRAKEHLTTATTMMGEMEMGLWLERAEAELKELG
jgi:class 3 adenylate cyclase/tetratricopeptide (TPR) repeat protein